MSLFGLIGTLTDVTPGTDWFMPGLAVGLPFTGTLSLQADSSSPPILTAVLQMSTGGHIVNGRSIGLEPLRAFADHVATGPFSSPTVQHGGYIDNFFFKVAISGASLGTAGFTVMGPGPDGSTKAGAATGSIQCITVMPSIARRS